MFPFSARLQGLDARVEVAPMLNVLVLKFEAGVIEADLFTIERLMLNFER